MNQLTVFYYHETFVLDSREVAERIGKRHSDLLETISGYEKHLLNGTFRSVDFFIPATYQDSTGRILPCYYLTRKGCDMVANKMIGKKGVLFTAAYVTKFEAMEKALANPHQMASDEAKKLRAEAMNLNAKTRQAKMVKDLARQFQDKLSTESVQALIAGLTEFLMGKPLLPLPKIEKTYTATEIGKECFVSANKIGKLANANGLKTDPYGIWVLGMSRYSMQQVPSFRYNEKGKARLLEILQTQYDRRD